ncbi:carbohydrate ABC transporter permease [Amycolatopsis roodepoortensis]|uniref:N-acetylglucosamine transport system permease protein n=1 Tax=Amycolatopsis roodepoortensis TaxID=700274 RepID=A0ABR9KZL1_9PSEU|nr:carbohydrate ABC transporter permease [Amycolatopsis roodepoortensis]MBE1573788.1 N-acetylglucosamine transport system permease protein [Amycolatopsis roodepoortensis]
MSVTDVEAPPRPSPKPVRKPPRKPRPAPGSKRFSPLRVLGSTIVWLFTAGNILVLYWLLTASFKTPVEIFTKPFDLPYQWFKAGKPFRNFIYAWNNAGFGEAVLTTVVLVGLATVVTVAVSAPCAYALTRLGVRGAGPMTNVVAIGMGVPFQTVIIPLFVVLSKVHLDNEYGLFVLYVALSIPFTVFLMTGFFRSLPDELEEAAALDGASPTRTFFSVMLPLTRGGMITALTLNAIGLWNETLLAIVFLKDQAHFTLSRALFTFYGAASYQSEYGGLIAGVAIVVLPMLVLYLVLARRIITGLTLGAGK